LAQDLSQESKKVGMNSLGHKVCSDRGLCRDGDGHARRRGGLPEEVEDGGAGGDGRWQTVLERTRGQL